MTHEHLNDEQLSAHLDGELDEQSDAAGRTVDARISGCETCRRRLASLSGARALVRRPVGTVAPAVREGAVASAIAQVLGAAAGAGATSNPPSDLAAHRARRPVRSTGVLVGAAAAAVLVVVGVSLGVSHGSSPTATSASSAGTRHAAAPEGVPQKAAVSGEASIPDLGSISSPQTLRTRLAPLVGTGDQLGLQGNAASTTARDNTAGAPSPGSFATAGAVPAQFATCVAAARQVTGSAGTLDLVATATYGHTPALVVVTDLTSTSSKVVSAPLAVVVARSGCRVLASTPT